MRALLAAILALAAMTAVACGAQEQPRTLRAWRVEPPPVGRPEALAAPTGHAVNDCMAHPSACGFPDVLTVGVKPGVPRHKITGTVTLSEPGAVFENETVRGHIDVTAPNVTIRNVKLVMTTNPWIGIETHTDGSQPGKAKKLIVEDVEIDMDGNWEAKGIAFDEYTARRVFFHNGSDCAHAGVNVTVENSLCVVGPDKNDDGREDSRSFCKNAKPHYDGFQSDGGDHITWRHNTIRMPCAQTSAILVSTNTAPISDVMITDNLMAGGGWTLYCNAGPDVGGTEVITGNRFARTYFSSTNSDPTSLGGGFYGPASGCQHADVFKNNVWDDTGEAVGS